MERYWRCGEGGGSDGGNVGGGGENGGESGGGESNGREGGGGRPHRVLERPRVHPRAPRTVDTTAARGRGERVGIRAQPHLIVVRVGVGLGLGLGLGWSLGFKRVSSFRQEGFVFKQA